MQTKEYQTEIVQTEEAWLEIRADWDRLSDGHPMLSFDWMHAWWQAYGAGSRLNIVVVRDDDGHVMGIAPWYECHQFIGPSLRFLGSGKACSDYLRVMSDADRHTQVCHAVTKSLSSRSGSLGGQTFNRGLRLEGLSENASETIELLGAFREKGFLIQSRRLESCWRIELPDSWEAMLLKLNNKFRRKIRKCMERFEDGDLKVNSVRHADDWPAALEILRRLHQARRQSLKDTGCFDDPRFAVFLNGAMRPMLAQCKARATWVESKGAPISIGVQLIGGNYTGLYQTGIDPAARALEPGHLMICQTLRQSIDERFEYYDFLRGDERYKSEWGAEPTSLIKAWMIPPTIWARSVHFAGEGALAVRNAYRRLRSPALPN